MLGTIIGGALGVGSSIFGGIKASKAAKKAKKYVEQEKRDNQAWYDREYNEDPLQSASAQRVLTQVSEQIRNRNKAAAGTAAVMGGSQEAAAAARAQNNQALADAASRIVAADEARKERVEAQYQYRKGQLNDQLRGIEQGRAAAITDAIGGVAIAGSAIAGIGDDDTSQTDATAVAPETTTAVPTNTPVKTTPEILPSELKIPKNNYDNYYA